FRGDPARLDLEGSCILEVTAGRVDLSIDLVAGGYVPVYLQNVEGPPGPRGCSRPLELERGSGPPLRIAGESAFAPAAKKLLVFLVRDDQAAAISGPYPRLEPPANTGIDDIYMRIEPGLLHQLVRCNAHGDARLRGLARGVYTLRV